MIIRQNPLFEEINNPKNKNLCAELAIKTVEAISTFTKLFPSSHPSAYFNTASLVECIYQLMPFLKDQARGEDDTAALRSFREARKLLSDLSGLTEGAKRALCALASVNIEDEDGISSDTIELRAMSCAAIQNELQLQHQAYDATCLSLPDTSDFLDHRFRIEGLNMWPQFSLGGHTMAREVSSRNDNGSPQFPISNFDFSSTRDFSLAQAANSEDLCYPSGYDFPFITDTI
jgi:hypothetical protein